MTSLNFLGLSSTFPARNNAATAIACGGGSGGSGGGGDLILDR